MKHSELLLEYFGKKVNEEWSGKNLFVGLKRLGEKRFLEGRNISKMSLDIGEKVSDEHKIALYDIFSIKAEQEHNSYFCHLMDVMCDAKDKEETAKEMDSMLLIHVLSAFIKVYNKVS